MNLEDLESEIGLLGSLITHTTQIDYSDVFDALSEGDFTDDRHRYIFASIKRVVESGSLCDPTVIVADLDRVGLRSAVGEDAQYLSHLMDYGALPGSVPFLCNTIRDKADRRGLDLLAAELCEGAHNNPELSEVLDTAHQKLLGYGDKESGEIHHVSDSIARMHQRIIQNHGKRVTGIPTGIYQLDSMTRGMQPGEMIVLAARPGMGKSMLALNIAEHTALNCGIPTAFISLEMSEFELSKRLVTARAGLTENQIEYGKISEAQWRSYQKAIADISLADLQLLDTSYLTGMGLLSKARRLVQGGVKLLVVDYLQLMDGEGNNRQETVSAISRTVKRIAKELKVPVIALAQVNRLSQDRKDKTPQLSELRESGSIEQDADMVWFIHREEYYTKEETPIDRLGTGDIIIAKQRNGPLGKVSVGFDGARKRFFNI